MDLYVHIIKEYIDIYRYILMVTEYVYIYICKYHYIMTLYPDDDEDEDDDVQALTC